jgi:hypothetical protein
MPSPKPACPRLHLTSVQRDEFLKQLGLMITNLLHLYRNAVAPQFFVWRRVVHLPGDSARAARSENCFEASRSHRETQ